MCVAVCLLVSVCVYVYVCAGTSVLSLVNGVILSFSFSVLDRCDVGVCIGEFMVVVYVGMCVYCCVDV